MKRPDLVRSWLIGVARAAGGAAIGGFLAIVLVVVYFAAMPGSWFLHSKDPVTVADSLVGDDIPFKWCRQPAFGLINADAVRTFYKADKKGKFNQAYEYRFHAGVEQTSDECQDLVLKATRQPQQEGTFYFSTDLTWREQGFEKHLSYRSNPYTLGATPESLKQRIKELEDQVKALRERLAVTTSTQRATKLTVPAITGSTPSTATTNQPTTSAPPDPVKPRTPPTTPSNPLIDLRPLLNGAYRTIKSVPVVGGLL